MYSFLFIFLFSLWQLILWKFPYSVEVNLHNNLVVFKPKCLRFIFQKSWPKSECIVEGKYSIIIKEIGNIEASRLVVACTFQAPQFSQDFASFLIHIVLHCHVFPLPLLEFLATIFLRIKFYFALCVFFWGFLWRAHHILQCISPLGN